MYGSSYRVFCDVRQTSYAGDMKVFHKAHESDRESRWHRGSSIFALDRNNTFLPRAIFYSEETKSSGCEKL